MPDADAVVDFPAARKPIPEVVQLTTDNANPRLSPNEMRAVRAATGGRGFTDLIGEESTDEDRTQLIVWAFLRRNGHTDITWDEAGDVIVEWAESDPTNGEPSMSSPPSADSGA